MERDNQPKHNIGYRILAYIYELLFLGSFLWLLMTCTKKWDWENDALTGIGIMMLSGLALFVIYHPHHENKK